MAIERMTESVGYLKGLEIEEQKGGVGSGIRGHRTINRPTAGNTVGKPAPIKYGEQSGEDVINYGLAGALARTGFWRNEKDQSKAKKEIAKVFEEIMSLKNSPKYEGWEIGSLKVQKDKLRLALHSDANGDQAYYRGRNTGWVKGELDTTTRIR